MNVQNMVSNNGYSIPNQFIIYDGQGNCFFQSYRSIIVKLSNDGKIYLDKYKYKYSQTTGKYRNLFLNEDLKETERKIKSGEYILTDLN